MYSPGREARERWGRLIPGSGRPARHRGHAQGSPTLCELSLLAAEVATRLRAGASTSPAQGLALARIDAEGSVGVDDSYPAVLDEQARAPTRQHSLHRVERTPGVAASRVNAVFVTLTCRFSHDLGAPLVDVLDAIGSTIDDTRALEEARHTAVAGPLMSTRVLVALPFTGTACALASGASPWQFYMGGIVGRMCALVGGVARAAGVASCRQVPAWCRRVEEGIDGTLTYDLIASASACGAAISRALDALADANTTEALAWTAALPRLGAAQADAWEDTPEWSHPPRDTPGTSWTSGTAPKTLLVRSAMWERHPRLVDAKAQVEGLSAHPAGPLDVFSLSVFLSLDIALPLTYLAEGIGVQAGCPQGSRGLVGYPQRCESAQERGPVPHAPVLRVTAREGRKGRSMTTIDRTDCAATRAQLIVMTAVQEGAQALRPWTSAKPTERRDPEEGATTAECAIGVIAAAGFADLFIVIFKSDTIRTVLESIIQEALNTR